MFTAHSGLCSSYVSVNPLSHSRVPSVCMLSLLVANGRPKPLCMCAEGQALPEHLLLQLPSATSLRKDGWGRGKEGPVPLIPGGESLAGSSLSAGCWCPPLHLTRLSRPRSVFSTPFSTSHLPRVHSEKFKLCGWRPRRRCDAAFRHWGATSPHCRHTQSPRGIRVTPALIISKM